MPSWKKVVASGSDASFSSLTVDTYVSASSFKGSFTGSLEGTASQAISSSYALTASYALFAANGGGGGISAIYIANAGITQGTASYFDFTGAGVTATVSNNTASINVTGGGGGGTNSGQTTNFTQSVAATTWTFVHNLNTRTPLVQVYDTSYNQIIPQYISSSNANTILINFGIATAGYAVASTGGTIIVTGSNVILNQTSPATTWSFEHNLNYQYPVFQIYGSTDEVIIPQRIVATDLTSSLIYFPSPVSGKAVATVGGFSGSAGAGVGFPYSGSAVITGSFLVSQSFVDFSNASYVTGSFTGSLYGSASFATSASFAFTASSANSFNVRNSLTASGLRYPTADGAYASQVLQTDAAGTLSFGDVSTTFDDVYNGEATTLVKGTPVYISGSNGANPKVFRADAADANKMPVTYIVSENIAAGNTGRGITLGHIEGIDLTGYPAGTSVYVAAGGGWTSTRPTGNNVTIQFLGLVTKEGSGGKGLVLNPGPATLPNIQTGYVWVGDSNSYPSNVSTSSLFVASASYAATSSYATNFTASNILVSGTITAQTLVVNTISSSVVYSSGSNIFGNSTANTQTFTGSVNITGSLNLNGRQNISGSLNVSESITATVVNSPRLQNGSQYIAQDTYTGITAIQNGSQTWGFYPGGQFYPAGTIAGSSYGSNELLLTNTTPAQLKGTIYGVQIITSDDQTGKYTWDFSSATGNLTAPTSSKLIGTASWSENSISSSFATFAYSASFAPGFSVSMSQATPALTWSFTHNLNSRNPVVQVYDTTYSQIIPNQIVGMDNSTTEIRFDYAQAGYAVFSNGGGLYVTGSTSTLVQAVGAVTWSFTHNLNNKYNTYEVYDSNDTVIIPSGIKALTNNSAEIYFATPQTGRVVGQFSGINGAPNATTASYALTATSSSYAATASYLNPITNSYVVLTQVSQSLNFVDDAAAEAGGVPLGGIYRNGNFILIRLS